MFNNGGDSWSLGVGNNAAGWTTVASGLQLGNHWNRFNFHYEAQTQSLDLYLNDKLVAANATLGHGNYNPDHVQIEFSGAGTDWFSEIKVGNALPRTRSTRFGREWVRDHAFTQMGLVLREQGLADTKYRDAGFTSVLAWENRPGLLQRAHDIQELPWHFHTGQYPLAEVQPRITDYVENYPGAEGILIWDEPIRPEFGEVAKIASWVRETYPDLLVYGNLYRGAAPSGKYYGSPWTPETGYGNPPVPYSYEDYLDEFVHFVQPDVLMMDIYPYREPPEGVAEQFIDEEYFLTLESVRRVALRAELPYWTFVQSFELRTTLDTPASRTIACKYSPRSRTDLQGLLTSLSTTCLIAGC